ncbi:MAG: hypothetical protein QMD92_00175 [bacterium]|nr:hypothetical protein [bacterium]
MKEIKKKMRIEVALHNGIRCIISKKTDNRNLKMFDDAVSRHKKGEQHESRKRLQARNSRIL